MPTMKRVIEAFSVITGVSFCVSALVNASAFAVAWRLNYFPIANPSDVVMSAFLVFAVLILGFGSAVLLSAISLFKFVPAKGADAQAHARTTQVAFWAKIIGFSAFVIMSLVGFFLGPSASYFSGLRLSAESQVGRECVDAPVLWLGSESAIIRCHDGIRVYRDLSKFVMRQA